MSQSISQQVSWSASQSFSQTVTIKSPSVSQLSLQSARLSITDAGCISHNVDCMSDLTYSQFTSFFYSPCENQIMRTLNKVLNTVLTKFKI